jgi:glycosyltransferase involved in cell wall biosynthesis
VSGVRKSGQIAERLRVLWLIKGLGLGGAEKLLTMAVPHLNRDRFDYQVGYFLPWKDALHAELAGAGLPVTCFNIRTPWSPLGLRRLVRYIRNERIDVVHMHLPIPGVYGRLAGRIAGVQALVYTEHNLWPRLHPLSRLLNRITFGMNDYAIAVSDDVRDSMKVKSPQPVTIENGIDYGAIAAMPKLPCEVRSELGISQDDFVVAKVANLTPKKNHELLLEAFSQLATRIGHARLILIGQYAGRKDELYAHAQRLGIADRVLFTGPRSDVIRIVQACDVFAMSSTFEGLPIALLEAMALGKPSVCTDVGGIPAVIRDGNEGFLVPSGQAGQLADRLLALAQDPRLCTKMGEAARQRVQAKFDISVMVRRVEEVYCNVLNAKSPKMHSGHSSGMGQ